MGETQHEQTPAVDPAEVDPIAPNETPDGDEQPSVEEEEQEHVEHEESEQPEPEPEQPQGMSERDVEKGFEKLGREADRHRNRVEEIMGAEAAMLAPCPLCESIIPGYVMPSPDLPLRFPLVREFIGDAQPRELQHDPNVRRCVTCDGWGVVDTGSRVQGQDELPCTDCNGQGWQGQRAPAVAGPIVAAVPLPTSNGPLHPTLTDEERAEVERLKAKGLVIIEPAAATA